MLEKKLLSIITVVYNDLKIEETIKSVTPFLTPEVEYIVIDGGSTDGTFKLLEKYEKYYSYWISEPDKGIYDAMNKALKHCNGEFVLHLNSGDILNHLPIDILKENINFDILSFPVAIDKLEIKYYPLFDWRVRFRTSLHHQGTFYRTKLVNYDCSYNIFADFDLNQRLYKRHIKYKLYNSPTIALHYENGVSAKTPKRRIEYSKIILKNFGRFSVFLFYGHLMYKLLTGRKNY